MCEVPSKRTHEKLTVIPEEEQGSSPDTTTVDVPLLPLVQVCSASIESLSGKHYQPKTRRDFTVSPFLKIPNEFMYSIEIPSPRLSGKTLP